jgi:hypothetical protein
MNTIIKHTVKFISKNLEALMWLAGLVYLVLINPYSADHLNLCAFNAIGIDSCPGCGLGKSISMIFHGDITHSFESHPLGIIALLIITFRIVTLINRNYKVSKLPLEVYNG